MVKINIADIRQEYTKGGLRENELPGDPLSLFSRWLQEAIDAEVDEPTAVIVGTVSPEGKTSTRTVLLKGLHDGCCMSSIWVSQKYYRQPETCCCRGCGWRYECRNS